MEILGRVPKPGEDVGYIVKVSHQEMCQLLDKSSLVDAKGYSGLEVGSKVDIDKIYDRLSCLRRNKDALEKSAKTLRAIADFITPLQDVVKGIIDTPE